MHSTALLTAVLAVAASTNAWGLEWPHANHQALRIRQDASGASPSPTSNPPSPSASANMPTSAAPTPVTSISVPPSSAPPSPSTSDNQPSPSSDNPSPSTSAAPSSAAPPSSNPVSSAAPSTESNGASTQPAPTSSAAAGPSTSIISITATPTPTVFPTGTVVVVVTSGNRVFSSTNTLVATTTPSATVVPTGVLASGGSDSSPSGVSDGNKKIIGGVVGGVGGAIVLGALAIVAWRLWGRKKNTMDEDDILVSGSAVGSGRNEKVGSAGGGSGGADDPFKSTLDQYHNPGRGVNTASNF